MFMNKRFINFQMYSKHGVKIFPLLKTCLAFVRVYFTILYVF